MTTNKKDLKSYLSTLEDTLNLYLVKKAPSIPENIKEIIVKYGPYLIIVSLFFSIPSILALFGLGSLFGSFHWGRYGLNTSYQFSMAILTISLVLQAIAVPGLLKRTMSSWRLVYYSVLINCLHSLITFNLANFLIGGLLSFYLLFQIKSYYK